LKIAAIAFVVVTLCGCGGFSGHNTVSPASLLLLQNTKPYNNTMPNPSAHKTNFCPVVSFDYPSNNKTL